MQMTTFDFNELERVEGTHYLKFQHKLLKPLMRDKRIMSYITILNPDTKTWCIRAKFIDILKATEIIIAYPPDSKSFELSLYNSVTGRFILNENNMNETYTGVLNFGTDIESLIQEIIRISTISDDDVQEYYDNISEEPVAGDFITISAISNRIARIEKAECELI